MSPVGLNTRTHTHKTILNSNTKNPHTIIVLFTIPMNIVKFLLCVCLDWCEITVVKNVSSFKM